MNIGVLYKGYLIRCESFQREQKGSWVPQYTVTRQDGSAQAKTDFPSHQYQFNGAYPTQGEANEFAVRRVQRWIDEKELHPHSSSAVLVDALDDSYLR
jgi:hypothetical protein